MASILNHVLPVFLLIALGQGLIRLRLAGPEFFATSDRLVYYVFFPALLFWKIGRAGSEVVFPPALVEAVLATVVLTWLGSLLWVRLRGLSPFQAGSFSQVCYRFNTYVGMAVVMTSFGEVGVARFGVIISLAIPLINLLAVGTLVWFGQGRHPLGLKLRLGLRAVLANPLILACLAGILWARLGPALPLFVERALALCSAITLPLALLSIGAGLSWGKLRGRLEPAVVSCLFKLVGMPLLGYVLLRAAGVEGLSLAVAMVFFALPTATSAYILSSQMDSDAELAAAAIVLSTLLSFFSLSLVLSRLG
jgi:hypothetical protein